MFVAGSVEQVAGIYEVVYNEHYFFECYYYIVLENMVREENSFEWAVQFVHFEHINFDLVMKYYWVNL